MTAATNRATRTSGNGARILLAAGLLVVAFGLTAAPAWAGGTPACTEILNEARVVWTTGAALDTLASGTTSTVVDQLVNVSVVWQDAAPIAVSPGDTARVLTFVVTNTGNGEDTFSLATLSALGDDDFDPIPTGIYLDGDANGEFGEEADEAYVSGTNDPTLAAGEALVVFVLSDIPPGVGDGDEGVSRLVVTSTAASGTPGSVVPGAAPCGADVVVGTSGGTAGDDGSYIASTVSVSVAKSATVADPYGAADPVEGAVVTYSLVVTSAGSGTALGVTVTDAIPEHTTYVPGTLALDGEALTDEADADAGDVGSTTPGTVTVDLGDVAGGSPARTITFDVTIE